MLAFAVTDAPDLVMFPWYQLAAEKYSPQRQTRITNLIAVTLEFKNNRSEYLDVFEAV